MPTALLTVSLIVATHQRHGGGGTSPMVGVVFLGVLATAGWLIFSRWRWRNTILATVAAWLVGLPVSLYIF